MNSKEKLAKKLGITVEELENRIQKNKEAEEDLIESTSKKKNKSWNRDIDVEDIKRKKCGCGNTKNSEGYCDGSHHNKS